MSKSLYLYCVTAGTRDEILDIKGIGGGRVFALTVKDLKAIVQECDPAFSTEDPKFVSEWVMVHQLVVDSAWERFETVVPFSFGTVIVAKDGKSARENLLEWLIQEDESLKEKLARLTAKAEYGVQVSWNREIVAPRVTRNDLEVQKLKKEIESKTPGTAYLMRQTLEGLLARRLESAADAYFREFYQKVSNCVEAVHLEKVRKDEPPLQMLMNLSCLVPKDKAARLGEELDKIDKIEGFRVRFTGPWPPYSFVSP